MINNKLTPDYDGWCWARLQHRTGLCRTGLCCGGGCARCLLLCCCCCWSYLGDVWSITSADDIIRTQWLFAVHIRTELQILTISLGTFLLWKIFLSTHHLHFFQSTHSSQSSEHPGLTSRHNWQCNKTQVPKNGTCNFYQWRHKIRHIKTYLDKIICI